MWRVEHDDDHDEEDLEEHEVRAALALFAAVKEKGVRTAVAEIDAPMLKAKAARSGSDAT